MSLVFYWILDQLIAFLANLNPERAKKVEGIKAEAARLDAEYSQFQKRLTESRAENERLSIELDRNFAERRALEDAITTTRAEAQKAKNQLDKLTGGDRVRVDL